MLHDLARSVADGATSARALVELSLTRIADHAGVNAVVALRAEQARQEADALDRAVASGQAVPGPLTGVPLLVKDTHDVAGLVTTHGSRWFADAPPATRDSLVVARLRAAGALVVGKTNQPEFCIEGFTDNPVHGATTNPWDPALSPGGSSGGSAAALAAGLAPLVTAGDGAGSARIPAAFCGLLGFKPTNGVIARDGDPDWIDFHTEGLMATTVADLALQLGAGRPHAGDPTALPVACPRPGCRAGSSSPTAPTTSARCPRTSPTSSPAARRTWPACSTSRWSGGSPATSSPAGRPTRTGSPWPRPSTPRSSAARASSGAWTSCTPPPRSSSPRASPSRRRSTCRPGAAGTPPSAGWTTSSVPTPRWSPRPSPCPGGVPRGEIPGRAPGLLGADVYSTAVQNMTGLPAISLPAGALPGGELFGLQVTMPRWADLGLLQLAARWEQHHPWPRTAPGHPEFRPTTQE